MTKHIQLDVERDDGKYLLGLVDIKLKGQEHFFINDEMNNKVKKENASVVISWHILKAN